jgi:hypothetical protein
MVAVNCFENYFCAVKVQPNVSLHGEMVVGLSEFLNLLVILFTPFSVTYAIGERKSKNKQSQHYYYFLRHCIQVDFVLN